MFDDVLGVVFDCDGLIIDSETAVFEAYRQLLVPFAVTLTAEQWRYYVGGAHDPLEWIATLVTDAPVAFDRDIFQAEKSRIFREVVQYTPMAGIQALVDDLHASGARLGVASNSGARWVVPALEKLGLADRFAAVVTRDDVANGKPAPDVYLEAARRLGVPPSRAVALEDSGHGAAAAKAAGFKVIAVPNWLTQGQDLGMADLLVTSAAELTAIRLRALVDVEVSA